MWELKKCWLDEKRNEWMNEYSLLCKSSGRKHLMTSNQSGIFIKNLLLLVPFAATCLDLKVIILCEGRQSQISYDITYILNLKKNDPMNLFTKQK